MDKVNNEKDKRQDLAFKAGDEANVTSRVTSGQLVLIAGAVLTFSASVISSNVIISTLSHSWKLILIWSWILFAGSVFAGLVGLVIDYRFFLRWHDYHQDVAEELGSGRYSDKNFRNAVAVVQARTGLPKKSSTLWPLIIQGVLIVLATTLFLAVISHAVLNRAK
jgi:hypothetical protein